MELGGVGHAVEKHSTKLGAQVPARGFGARLYPLPPAVGKAQVEEDPGMVESWLLALGGAQSTYTCRTMHPQRYGYGAQAQGNKSSTRENAEAPTLRSKNLVLLQVPPTQGRKTRN